VLGLGRHLLFAKTFRDVTFRVVSHLFIAVGTDGYLVSNFEQLGKLRIFGK
jgi:hypothetical protein